MIVVIGNEKGGTGKTTLAVNMATMLAVAGKSVLLIDTDPQQSAGSWSTIRDESQPGRPAIPCLFKTGKGLGYEILKMADKFEVILIDAGGRIAEELLYAVVVCDTLVVPIKAGAFDVWSMSNMDSMLKRVHRDFRKEDQPRVRALTLINQVKGQHDSNPEAREVRKLMMDEFSENFEVYRHMIGDRVAYSRAAKNGLAVCELTGKQMDTKAVDEMSRLYAEIFGQEWVNHAS